MKATEQNFSLVLFIKLYKLVLTFESLLETINSGRSNESYWVVLSCGVVLLSCIIYMYIKIEKYSFTNLTIPNPMLTMMTSIRAKVLLTQDTSSAKIVRL